MKPKMILVHDDGFCTNGEKHTELVDYECPICKITPDMQSTCFICYCPDCDIKLKNKKCIQCLKEFDF